MHRSTPSAIRWLPILLVLALAGLPALVTAPTAPLSLRHSANLLGWLGAGMLATSMLLAVREPRFTAWFGGIDRMYRWHHSISTLGYVAILAHPLALAASVWPDYVLAWRSLAPVGQPWAVTLGWLALLGMTAGLTSTFAVRINYGLWRRLHAALGLAVLLGIIHILAVDPASKGGWSVILPVLLALLWRVLDANRRGSTLPFEVQAVQTLAHGGTTLVQAQLRPLAAPIRMQPGQFVMAAFFEGPHFHGCGEYHPYTASRVSPTGELTLDIKSLGDCTRHIQALEPGVAVRLNGPYGTFLTQRDEAPQLWIAGGIGITPFLAVLRAAPVTQPTDFLYVFRGQQHDPYIDEVTQYASQNSNLRFEPLSMDEDPAPLLAKLASVPDLPVRAVYLCGPPALTLTVTQWLQQHGVAKGQIHLENFDFR